MSERLAFTLASELVKATFHQHINDMAALAMAIDLLSSETGSSLGQEVVQLAEQALERSREQAASLCHVLDAQLSPKQRIGLAQDLLETAAAGRRLPSPGHGSVLTFSEVLTHQPEACAALLALDLLDLPIAFKHGVVTVSCPAPEKSGN